MASAGDTLEKYDKELKMLSHRFKAKCKAQKASLAAYRTENLQPEDRKKTKNQTQGLSIGLMGT